MELQNIIQEMDRLQIELDSLRPIPEERMGKLMQKLRLDWNYHSNSIEGNTLSASETKAFILFGITAKGKPFRDYIEMRGHNEALKKVEEIVHKDISITETLIKDLHKLILVEAYSDSEAEINPGHYKTRPNYLYSPEGERVDFAMPNEVAEKMNRLVNWLNNHLDPPKRKKKQYDAHPLLIACIFHLEFIRIHPFGDGNGRLARILMNLILMTCGYVPSIVRLEKRKDYYGALNLSEVDNIAPLAEFIGEECIITMQLAIKAAKNEPIEEDDDLDKELFLLKKELSKENVLNLEATSENISQAIEENVIPVFIAIEKKCAELKEYFFDYDRKIEFQLMGENHISSVGSKESNFDTILENWLHKQIRNERKKIKFIKYSFQLKGLKKTINADSFWIDLETRFEDFNYTISTYTNRNKPLQLAYGKKLDNEIIKGIISPLIKELIENIKTINQRSIEG